MNFVPFKSVEIDGLGHDRITETLSLRSEEKQNQSVKDEPGKKIIEVDQAQIALNLEYIKNSDTLVESLDFFKQYPNVVNEEIFIRLCEIPMKYDLLQNIQAYKSFLISLRKAVNAYPQYSDILFDTHISGDLLQILNDGMPDLVLFSLKLIRKLMKVSENFARLFIINGLLQNDNLGNVLKLCTQEITEEYQIQDHVNLSCEFFKLVGVYFQYPRFHDDNFLTEVCNCCKLIIMANPNQNYQQMIRREIIIAFNSLYCNYSLEIMPVFTFVQEFLFPLLLDMLSIHQEILIASNMIIALTGRFEEFSVYFLENYPFHEMFHSIDLNDFNLVLAIIYIIKNFAASETEKLVSVLFEEPYLLFLNNCLESEYYIIRQATLQTYSFSIIQLSNKKHQKELIIPFLFKNLLSQIAESLQTYNSEYTPSILEAVHALISYEDENIHSAILEHGIGTSLQELIDEIQSDEKMNDFVNLADDCLISLKIYQNEKNENQ